VNISGDGAIGSKRTSAVGDSHHIHCLWTLSVFTELHQSQSADDTTVSLTLTFPPNNLNTVCNMVRLLLLLLMLLALCFFLTGLLFCELLQITMVLQWSPQEPLGIAGANVMHHHHCNHLQRQQQRSFNGHFPGQPR